MQISRKEFYVREEGIILGGRKIKYPKDGIGGWCETAYGECTVELVQDGNKK